MGANQEKQKLDQGGRTASRYDDSSQDRTNDPLINQYLPAYTTVSSLTHPSEGYSALPDAELKDILLKDGVLTKDNPKNVLDIRRQWPPDRQPVPETRQLNRILYQLRQDGKVVECPPNNYNKKPTWKLSDE